MVKRLIKAVAERTGNVALYRKARPSGKDFADFLKRHRILNAMGEHCYISRGVNITDPAYVRLGDNVRLSDCHVLGHDGSINMINRAFSMRLDSVGKVDIHDNVFIGLGAIILPGVTIGHNSIIGAGCVVNRNVPPDSIMVGAPAQRIGSLSAHVANMQRRNETFPWRGLIESRASDFDAALEPELIRQRVAHFYGAFVQLENP